jgi:hypothetical protein
MIEAITNMKTLILLYFFTALLMVACQGASRRLSYSVAIVNDGKETISVDDVILNSYDRPAVAGDFLSGQKKTDVSPTHQPNEDLKVSWIVKRTGEKTERNVLIKLPKGFDTGDNPTIVLHINPESKEVKVTYEVQEGTIGGRRTLE